MWASIPDVSSAVQVQLIYVADTIENIVMKIYQEKGCSYSHAELLRVLQSGHPGREFTKDEVCRAVMGAIETGSRKLGAIVPACHWPKE